MQQNCHTLGKEKNSTNKTVKLNTFMTAEQYKPKQEPAAVAVALYDQLYT
jgi:hypothetical protein